MKQALTRALITALTLITLITIIPLSANASSTSNKQKIFSFLTNEMDLNSAAACGIMANIEKESNFKSSTVIRDSNGLQSGGLCMWNGSRLSSLKNYCNKKGYDYLSIEGQLNYLKYELNLSSYKHILNYLKKVANNKDGAYNAAYYWCYYFEIPANRAAKAAQRGNTAIKSYWPTYGNKTLSKPTLSLSNGKTAYDLDSYVTLTWTSGGENASYYKLYVAEKKNGSYDWTNAKIYTIDSSLKRKIDTDSLGKGSYAAYVKAVHSATLNSKSSNTVKFVIDCQDHSYKSVVTKEPTLVKEGTKTLTCKICGYKTTKSIAKVNYKTIADYQTTAPSAKGRAHNNITIQWDEYKGADGYKLYMYNGEKYECIADVSADTFKYLVKNLNSATIYKFKLKAYVIKDSKKYCTSISDVYTTTTKTVQPVLNTVTGKQGGKAILKWDKVDGADSYIIYASTSKTGEYKKIATVEDGKTSYTVTGLKPGKAYYFYIQTRIELSTHNVYSVPSNIKSAIVL